MSENRGKWDDMKVSGGGISMIMKQVEGHRMTWNRDK